MDDVAVKWGRGAVRRIRWLALLSVVGFALAACNPTTGSVTSSWNGDGFAAASVQAFEYTGPGVGHVQVEVTSASGSAVDAQVTRRTGIGMPIAGVTSWVGVWADGSSVGFQALGDVSPGNVVDLGFRGPAPDSVRYGIRVVDDAGQTTGDLTVVALAGPIVTAVGGLGRGAATNVGQQPRRIAASGNWLYVADGAIVRRVNVSTGVEEVFAGGATSGFGGDGGAAISAKLSRASGLAVDGSGSVYIADESNFRVRKVTTDGTISTVAGNGIQGFADATGPARQASIGIVSGLATDPAGDVYICDITSGRVRKVTPDGVISTVAGNGTLGYSGDGLPATSAELYNPSAVAVDSAGNVYVADMYNERIRIVGDDGLIHTVAGTGTSGDGGDGGPAADAQLYNPDGLAIDPGGDVLISQSDAQVRMVSTSGTISTVAGNVHLSSGFSGDGGPATLAQLSSGSSDVAETPTGMWFIADQFNYRVRQVTPGGTISTVAGTGQLWFGGDNGPATAAQVSRVYSLAVDPAGALVLADSDSNRVRRIAPDGTITTVAGNGTRGATGDGGPATSAELEQPVGIAIDDNGSTYIDDGFATVRKIDAHGTITRFAGTGSWSYGGDGGPATDAQLKNPTGLATDADGSLLIADTSNNRIRKVAADGTITTIAGTGTQGFSGDGGPATAAQLNSPLAIATDATGATYVSDSGNNRIRRIAPDGTITTIAGTGTQGFSGDGGPATAAQLSDPQGLAASSDGQLYVADVRNSRIRRVDTAGNISTVAGNGNPTYAGDAGPPLLASLNHPAGIAFNQRGDAYIADPDNQRIRFITAT